MKGHTSLELLTSFINSIFELSLAGVATEMMKVLSVLISKQDSKPVDYSGPHIYSFGSRITWIPFGISCH